MLMEVAILDFEPIGSLKFYALQSTGDYERGFPVNYLGNIYWRNASSPVQGYGPFNNLHDALQHFKWMYHNKPPLKPIISNKDSNVMYVDFVAKKRL